VVKNALAKKSEAKGMESRSMRRKSIFAGHAIGGKVYKHRTRDKKKKSAGGKDLGTRRLKAH